MEIVVVRFTGMVATSVSNNSFHKKIQLNRVKKFYWLLNSYSKHPARSILSKF